MALMAGGLTRLVIGQSLASDALQRERSALRVLDAKLRPIVVSEIELFQVAVQAGLADRVIGSRDSAL
jgi:hypothetical protein